MCPLDQDDDSIHGTLYRYFIFRVKGAPEVCVDSLLEASVKYSPHFDWVVAHIG
jgi:hypothetical protein